MSKAKYGMHELRHWIALVEGVINFSDHQREPQDMTPVVVAGEYLIHPAKKGPESTRFLDYIVWIDGPEHDEDHQIDIRRYAGPEPEKMLGLPQASIKNYAAFNKRAKTLATYGQDKPPEVRFNPAWVLWRKRAILKMAANYGLID
jgi:hypothetical protein